MWNFCSRLTLLSTSEITCGANKMAIPLTHFQTGGLENIGQCKSGHRVVLISHHVIFFCVGDVQREDLPTFPRQPSATPSDDQQCPGRCAGSRNSGSARQSSAKNWSVSQGRRGSFWTSWRVNLNLPRVHQCKKNSNATCY